MTRDTKIDHLPYNVQKMIKKTKSGSGRDLADYIFNRMKKGVLLLGICAEHEVTHRTIKGWLKGYYPLEYKEMNKVMYKKFKEQL